MIAEHPGRPTCTVTETPPTGGLLNASYAWGAPTFSAQPVRIGDQATSDVTITNTVVQRSARSPSPSRSTARAATPAATDRALPGAVHVRADQRTDDSGTPRRDTVPGRLAGDADPGRLGVLVRRETLTTQPGDFIDRATCGPARGHPTTVTIGDGTTAAVTSPTRSSASSARWSSPSRSSATVQRRDGANFTVGYELRRPASRAAWRIANGART